MTERTPALVLLFASPLRLFARFIPLATALFLVAIANLPISFTGGLLPAPALALAAIYFWALLRPNLMTAPIVLVIGLAEDLLSGGPPGLWATGFLAAYAVIERQRKTFGESYGAGAAVAFAGAVLAAAATAYVLACVIYMRLLPIAPLLLECVVTVLLFPLLDPPLAFVDRAIGRFPRSAG